MSTMTAFDQDDGDKKKSSWNQLFKNVNEIGGSSTMISFMPANGLDSNVLDESRYDYPDADLGYFNE